MDEYLQAIAAGGEFDVTEAIRVIAKRLTELDGLARGLRGKVEADVPSATASKKGTK